MTFNMLYFGIFLLGGIIGSILASVAITIAYTRERNELLSKYINVTLSPQDTNSVQQVLNYAKTK